MAGLHNPRVGRRYRHGPGFCSGPIATHANDSTCLQLKSSWISNPIRYGRHVQHDVQPWHDGAVLGHLRVCERPNPERRCFKSVSGHNARELHLLSHGNPNGPRQCGYSEIRGDRRHILPVLLIAKISRDSRSCSQHLSESNLDRITQRSRSEGHWSRAARGFRHVLAMLGLTDRT